MRLAIIRTHPTQYFAPLYRALAQVPGLEIKVFYLFKDRGQGEFDPDFNQKISWDVNLLEGYDFEFVETSPLPFQPKHIFESRSPQLIRKLKSGKFDAIFCAGYALWLDWQVIFFAIRNNIPLICRPELNELGRRQNGLKNWIRKKILIWYFHKVSAFLFIGKKAKECFLNFKGDDSKAFFAPYSVDNESFKNSNVTNETKANLRSELGFKDCDLLLMYCGKFTSKKGIYLLPQALKHVAQKLKIGVLLVGDGSEKETLLKQLGELNLQHIHCAGFINQTQLPKYYGIADVLVVPSWLEPWGLVVNEAMACGTPVIASDRVGAAYDLIEDEKTGYVFTAGDPIALAKSIEAFYARFKSGLFNRDVILKRAEGYSIKESVKGFCQVLEYLNKDPRSV